MTDPRYDHAARIARERRAFQYFDALTAGDFDTISTILVEAERDPELERLVLEINAEEAADLQQTRQSEDAAVVTRLLRTCFPAALDAPLLTADSVADETELPPLTVGDTMARLAANGDIDLPHERRELQTLQAKIRPHLPLPEDLSGASVRALLERMGVTMSRRLERAFRDAAILLAQGRQQDRVRLAATRRQNTPRVAAHAVAEPTAPDYAALNSAAPSADAPIGGTDATPNQSEPPRPGGEQEANRP